MDYNIKKELNKIRTGFLKVKKEIKDLKKEKKLLEKISNKENLDIDRLKKEIEFLKKVIYNIQTSNEVIIKEEKKEIIGNRVSLKVHYSSCPFAKKISPEHMVLFPTLKEAKKKGYSECICITQKN